MKRRIFLKSSGYTTLGLSAFGLGLCKPSPKTTTMDSKDGKDLFFKISLAQWSLNQSLFSKKLDNLDFVAKTKNDFGIEGVEYVNQFFMDKAKDNGYLNEMNKRADDHGVTQLLIMVDNEGGLAELNDKMRNQAVENHFKWVEAAKHLACHSIRVNAYGVGSREDVGKAAIDGLGKLTTFAQDFDLNVIVENHGGYSSDGKWLSGIMEQINLPNCGTLPDFGNFCITYDNEKCTEEYDRYLGVEELMPFAKAVSAKSAIDENGNSIDTDFLKMMKIVKKAGYTGWVGIESGGRGISEDAAVLATKKILEKVGRMI